MADILRFSGMDHPPDAVKLLLQKTKESQETGSSPLDHSEVIQYLQVRNVRILKTLCVKWLGKFQVLLTSNLNRFVTVGLFAGPDCLPQPRQPKAA